MAEYLLLIYGDEKAMEAGGQAMWDELMAAHRAFGDKHGSSMLGGNALQPISTARSIRHEGDRAVVAEGPLAQAEETLGGYYLVEAKDLEEAIAIAKDVPAPNGGVEVRPVMVFD
jgi:hypothetical protein